MANAPKLMPLDRLHQAPEDQQEAPHGFAIGISHYHKDKGKSYVQVHDDMVHETHTDAVKAVHARIDQHKDFEHGVYDPAQLNPNGQYPHKLVKGATEYHPNPYPWASLPQIDGFTGQLLGDEMWVPHVDNCRLGHCYQAVLQEQNGGRGSLENYNIGFSSKEGAIAGAHAIVDQILVPYALQKETERAEAASRAAAIAAESAGEG